MKRKMTANEIIQKYHYMTKDERTIFIELKRFSNYEHRLTHKHFEQFGIDKRMLAFTVREMNDKYKGWFHLGSSKKGYWYCKNEREALVSLASYNDTIISMLGERKKIKEQVRVTFAENRNLFGELEIDEHLLQLIEAEYKNNYSMQH